MKKINALYFRSRWKKLVGQTLLHLTMAILLFCMIYPLAMSVWCAFKTTAEYDLSKFYPTLPMKISNLATAFSKVGGYMYNTVAVAVFETLRQWGYPGLSGEGRLRNYRWEDNDV